MLLEQNYRSTASILSVANTIIAPAKSFSFVPKQQALWTTQTESQPVTSAVFSTDEMEAEYVASEIAALYAAAAASGGAAPSVAILFRVASLGKAFERQLLKAKVSYRVVGGCVSCGSLCCRLPSLVR